MSWELTEIVIKFELLSSDDQKQIANCLMEELKRWDSFKKSHDQFSFMAQNVIQQYEARKMTAFNQL